jgi:hypothetical protein
MSYLGFHQVMCWLDFILIRTHFQSCDILFIWIHLGLSNPPIHTQLQTSMDTTSTLTLCTLSVHNSFPSLSSSCHQSLATPNAFECTPRTLATLQVLDSLTLSVSTINRAFLFTKDMLDCTNLFTSIHICKPSNTSCCALTRCAGKT